MGSNSEYPAFNSGFSATPTTSTEDDSHANGGLSFTNSLDSLDFGIDQKTLLDELDKLRDYGVDEFVELPQLVVVGDQSSGKSSVLEAISELPFPRSSIRCTRFATQIKLRHAKEASFSVQIIPDSKRSQVEQQRLAQFPATFPDTTPFSEIMDLATRTICSDNNPSFCSRDVFSIEISGPTKPHLTIVDLPGLIQASNIYQSQADVNAIKDLAFHYMRNQRTIILAIVSAANDLELQPVLGQEARQFDPNGARTLGIITKPDKTETTEREAQFLELARNQNVTFKLGWHVLRNRSPDEMNAPTEERRRTERRFFAHPSNWSTIGQENLGIDSLRKKLSTQLVKHIMHEMPKVQKEIRVKLEDCKAELARLGDRKDTPEEMRDELRELCEKSQALTRTAMEGQYVDLYGPAFFHPTPQIPNEFMRKLRARLVLENDRFAEEMATRGHLIEIIDDDDAAVSNGLNGHASPKPGATANGHPQVMSRVEYVKRYVEPLLNVSPGLELMMDRNPLLVYALFRSYSENWTVIANQHMQEIQRICNDFLQEAIDFVWPEDMRDRAWSAFVEGPMEGRLEGAYQEIQKLFRDRTRLAKPYDPEHTKKVMEWMAELNKNKSEGTPCISEYAPDVFLQKMLVYYELTRKTFTSNVIVQVIERHLVDDLDRIFNITHVMELDDDTVIAIASEDEMMRQRRLQLRNTKRILEMGDRICRKYMARRDLRLDDISKPEPSKAQGRKTFNPQLPPRESYDSLPTTDYTPTYGEKGGGFSRARRTVSEDITKRRYQPPGSTVENNQPSVSPPSEQRPSSHPVAPPRPAVPPARAPPLPPKWVQSSDSNGSDRFELRPSN